MPHYYSHTEIIDLVEKFNELALPAQDWTHQAHLIVGIWHCFHYDHPIAMKLVRTGIKRYNEAIGTPNTDSGGYHETITQFWLWTARKFVSGNKRKTLVDVCNEFLNSQYIDKTFPFLYYSQEVLFSVKARKNWVEPDLKPLDKLI